MGKPTGFLEYERETAKVLPPKERIQNFNEFRIPLNKEKQKPQKSKHQKTELNTLTNFVPL